MEVALVCASHVNVFKSLRRVESYDDEEIFVLVMLASTHAVI
jgi:hypothetical protein